MEGLKAVIHKFDFGSCKAEMNVMVDDRDGTIFVSDDCLDAIKVLVGRTAARSISTAAVFVDGRHLNLLNGFKHQPDAIILDLPLKREADVIPFKTQQEAFDVLRDAPVLSITRK